MLEFILVLTTVPNKATAEEISRLVVREGLAACATITGVCTSLYWWKNEISQDEEFLLIIKTKASLYAELEEKIKEIHPYEVPEILALPLIQGLPEYLNWIDKETKS